MASPHLSAPRNFQNALLPQITNSHLAGPYSSSEESLWLWWAVLIASSIMYLLKILKVYSISGNTSE